MQAIGGVSRRTEQQGNRAKNVGIDQLRHRPDRRKTPVGTQPCGNASRQPGDRLLSLVDPAQKQGNQWSREEWRLGLR